MTEGTSVAQPVIPIHMANAMAQPVGIVFRAIPKMPQMRLSTIVGTSSSSRGMGSESLWPKNPLRNCRQKDEHVICLSQACGWFIIN